MRGRPGLFNVSHIYLLIIHEINIEASFNFKYSRKEGDLVYQQPLVNYKLAILKKEL